MGKCECTETSHGHDTPCGKPATDKLCRTCEDLTEQTASNEYHFTEAKGEIKGFAGNVRLAPSKGREDTFDKTQKKIKAVVILRADSIRNAGLENTFTVLHRTSIERIILPVFDFNIEDATLAELRFYPTVLKGRWMHLFVPKNAILAIVKLENPEDDSTLGFKTEEIEQTPAA